jgi:hypothetical protein
VTVLKAAADFTAKNCYVVLVPLTLFILAVIIYNNIDGFYHILDF